MDSQVQQTKPQTLLCFNCQSINDVNNNFTNSTCVNCQSKARSEDKEAERMIIVPDTSSGDEYYCSSCSSVNDPELISLDTQKLWLDIAHIIKCVYRETSREFTENHSSSDICKAKEHVQILTQINPESLFNKVESIVLVYVDEIRNQVLKRLQTCLKTSNDVQLFISFLLDEYNTFIQAAKNVSAIVHYLEEHYMKSFHLTWLLYNKHLYEKLVYMDKKIQHSMSTMIDLLQPSNNDENNYSPAEYTQLLNRFLAFDEEMLEIACLYKDCQTKMTPIARNRNPTGIIVEAKKKKICKKKKRIKHVQENLNSSTTTAVNIPIFSNCSVEPVIPPQGSNGSSIGSGICGKESSSISSVDEYLLDNNTSSSSYTKDESDGLIHDDKDLHEQLLHGILNNVSPMAQIQREIDELKLTENTNTDENEEKQTTIPKELHSNDKPQIPNESSSKKCRSSKSSSGRRKESSTTIPTYSSSLPKKHDLIFPPKPPSSSSASKFQADFRPLSIPLLTKNESSSCPPFLSAKIQSVSFTAGTFGSITTNESSHLSTNQSRLSINLTRKSGTFCPSNSSIGYNNLDQLLRQAASHTETSSLSSKSTDDVNSLNDKTCDFCCCDLFHDPTSSTSHGSIPGCVTCMSLPNPTMLTCGYNPRDIEMKERLKLKLTKRTVQNLHDQEKVSTGNKSKTKPIDNNIDDLVRFIDGNETQTATNESTTKKNKKKREKQLKSKSNNPLPINPIVETPQPLSKRQQKAKLKLEQIQVEESSTTIPPTPLVLPIKTTSPIKRNVDSSSENSIPPEEEVNWITISRKQNKHKPPVPSLLAIPIPPKNTKQKMTNTKKTMISNTPTQSRQKVILPTGNSETINRQQQNTIVTPSHQQQKTNYTIQVIPSSVISNAVSLEVPSSSIYWDPNGYLLPPTSQSTIIPLITPGPVQRPSSSASGTMNTTTSRCIRRPSSEPHTDRFPFYSPMNYTVGSSTSSWNDTPTSQWDYPPTNDFPLYDPFNSGTGLTISSSTLLTNRFEENYDDRHIPQKNDVDEMDAFDKEIEDFKKFCFENIPLETRK